MDNNADTENLNLSCGENDIVDELKIGADETYDTRSEVSSSSSDTEDEEEEEEEEEEDDDDDDDDDSSQPSITSVSTKSSKEDTKRTNRSRGKRRQSRDSSSSSPEAKRPRSKEDTAKAKGTNSSAAKSYDYATKLNYLFRDARY